MKFPRVLVLTLAAATSQAVAGDLWIGPEGSNDNEGSRLRPLASLQAALARDPRAHVFVLPGTYPLTKPILLDASHSGAIIEADGGSPHLLRRP